MPRLVFECEPYYHNKYDMSWEEEHVCSLCDGKGCRACNDLPPTAVSIPITVKEVEVKPKRYWEIEEEKYRERKAEAMKQEMPWIVSLIQKDWGRK